MFFVLSKVLYFLLIPLLWILGLLVAARIVKNKILKHRLRITAIIITLIFSNPYLYRLLVFSWQYKPTVIEMGKNYSVGILLGGMAGYDKHGNGFFNESCDRLIATETLYHSGIIKKILISGGNGALTKNQPAEAFFLQQVLLKNGVKKEDILIEPLSRNTYENGVFSKKILDSIKLMPPYILITSAIHMKRSVAVFKKQGIQIIPYTSDYKVIEENNNFYNTIIPSAKVLDNWQDYIKEVVGYYVYKLTGKA